MESQRLAETQGFPPIAGPPLTDRGVPASIGARWPDGLSPEGWVGRRPSRSPDRLQASDRWLTGRPDLPVLPPPETPRTSPAWAGRRVSATGEREAAFFESTSGPSPWRPHTASAVPAGGPAPDRPAKSAPSAPPWTAPWVPASYLQYPLPVTRYSSPPTCHSSPVTPITVGTGLGGHESGPGGGRTPESLP